MMGRKREAGSYKSVTHTVDIEILKKSKEKCERDGYVMSKVIELLLKRWANDEIQTYTPLS